ncbi:MAG: hypothetical protein WC862_00820 [Patescibacteria group bacterium]
MTTKQLTKQLNRIGQLEKELQLLKIVVFKALPKQTGRTSSAHAERTLLKAAKDVRNDLWQSRYAKKVARVS